MAGNRNQHEREIQERCCLFLPSTRRTTTTLVGASVRAPRSQYRVSAGYPRTCTALCYPNAGSAVLPQPNTILPPFTQIDIAPRRAPIRVSSRPQSESRIPARRSSRQASARGRPAPSSSYAPARTPAQCKALTVKHTGQPRSH